MPVLKPEEIDPMRKALLDFMPDKLRYSTVAWSGAARQLQDKLAEEREDTEWNKSIGQFDIPDGADIRDVLHAGWLKRWQAPEDDSEVAAPLGTRVASLCHKISSAPKSGRLDPDRNAA